MSTLKNSSQQKYFISKGYAPSPIGFLKIELTDGKVISVSHEQKKQKDSVSKQDLPVFNKTKAQLKAYFAGRLKKFNLPLVTEGTEFQQQVWREMAKIPFGSTRTYGELAKAIGRPRASRAIGNACNGNPHLIVIPCHRVVGATGVGGFAIGSKKKKHLLNHETHLSHSNTEQ